MAESGLYHFRLQVPKVTHTEFCQGRTMRWALAWSFYENVKVPSPPSKKRKLEKPRKPITFLVLESTMKELAIKASSLGLEASEGTEAVAAWIKKILGDLKVQYKCIPCGKDEVSLFLTALENSWIHLRRKKRERVRQLRELPRASIDFLQASEEKENPQNDSGKTKECEENEAGSIKRGSLELESPEGLNSSSPVKEGNSQACTEGSEEAKPPAAASAGAEEAGGAKESKAFGTGSQAAEARPRAAILNEWFLFKCILNVKQEKEDFLVEMHWVEGQNRDLMNQLCTYLKNQIFRLVGT